MFWISVSYLIYDFQIFSHFVNCLFTLLIVSFDAQSFCFYKANLSVFSLFTFFTLVSKKSLLYPMS